MVEWRKRSIVRKPANCHRSARQDRRVRAYLVTHEVAVQGASKVPVHTIGVPNVQQGRCGQAA